MIQPIPRPRTIAPPTEHEVYAAAGTWFRCTGVRLKRAHKWAKANGYVLVRGGDSVRFRPITPPAAGEIRMSGDTEA